MTHTHKSLPHHILTQLPLLTLQRHEGRRPDLLDPARVDGGHGRPHAFLPVLERAREPAARRRRRGHGGGSGALGLVDRAPEAARRRRAEDEQEGEDDEPRHYRLGDTCLRELRFGC